MTTVRFQSAERDAREQTRQKIFRKQFVEATPPRYRGEIHLLTTLVITGGTIAFCAFQLRAPTLWEWMLLVPIVLLGNWVEWAAHRYILHRPVKGLEAVYKRHCTVHHQFFTHHDLSYKGHKEWRALLFPPLASLAFLLAALPFAALAGWLISANAGFIVMLTMASYYLLYEGLHTLSHLEDKDYPWLRRVPLINTVRRMHTKHHVLGFMQTRNFNLTFPICDALFGTSDLDRGLLGTLFNGPSDKHMRPELRIADDSDVSPEASRSSRAESGTSLG
jgi:hypothetical protein